MGETPGGEITSLLVRWQGGDANALDALIPLVYQDLRRVAKRYLAHERPGHTLQSTPLVNEVYLRLAPAQHAEWRNRAHTATALNTSASTVKRDWTTARAWLLRELAPDP